MATYTDDKSSDFDCCHCFGFSGEPLVPVSMSCIIYEATLGLRRAESRQVNNTEQDVDERVQ